jgi:hypothetical protein
VLNTAFRHLVRHSQVNRHTLKRKLPSILVTDELVRKDSMSQGVFLAAVTY